jgi:hypothetical protein
VPPLITEWPVSVTPCFSTVPPHATLRAVSGFSHQNHPICDRMILHRLSDLDTGVSCMAVATQSTPYFVSKRLRTRHFSHDARPAFAFFPVAPPTFDRWHKPTTALRYRCSIIVSNDGIHAPSCFPAANGTHGFLGLRVRLILGYTHFTQMQSFPSRSKNPQTAGRTWLAPRTMLSDNTTVTSKHHHQPSLS